MDRDSVLSHRHRASIGAACITCERKQIGPSHTEKILFVKKVNFQGKLKVAIFALEQPHTICHETN